ncbi:ABC transporter permease [Methyloversatilis sp. XJ19-13]|uniref:ABC transporter permease n=1 Tax=Methyloversatilis sp. XJ19-13 TaxID=2963430 RepID=UPI00211C44D7|nr:FtsX-like permease family protein [Methyloversatilis sp. XJ19-13]MCQ9372894.1 ABC transporter permease [Methyloversatilis sp. XJ19-13]
MKFWLLDLRLAMRSVLRQGRRTMIAIGAVSFGVVAMILSAGFIEWLMDGMRESTIKSQLGHIQVVRPGYVERGTSDPFGFMIEGEEAARAAVQSSSGVKVIAPRLSFNGLASKGENTFAFLGQGVSPQAEAVLSSSIRISRGRNLSADGANEMIMGRGLAINLDAQVGDTIVLLTTTAGGSINAVEAPIVGLFTSVSKEYDDSALRMPIALAQQLVKVSGAQQWLVLLERTDDTDSKIKELRKVLPAAKLELVPWYQLADFYNKTRDLFSSQINVVRLIILMIIVLSISNTLSMSVMERVSEIGTCMALGLTRSRILRIFVSEGLMLGVVGGGLGVVLGCLLAVGISAVGIPLPPPPGMEEGFDGKIMLTFDIVAQAMLVAVVSSFVSSLYPAWRASRMNIVDALRQSR